MTQTFIKKNSGGSDAPPGLFLRYYTWYPSADRLLVRYTLDP